MVTEKQKQAFDKKLSKMVRDFSDKHNVVVRGALVVACNDISTDGIRKTVFIPMSIVETQIGGES